MAYQFSIEGQRRWIVGGLTLSVAALYVALCWPLFRGGMLEDQSDLPSLRAASRFEPSNAEAQYRLGNGIFLVEQDFPAARAAMEKAVSLNPFSSRYWLGLATLRHVMGDAAGESFALDTALRMEPSNPSVAWTVANFDIVRGEIPKGMALLRTVVEYAEDGHDVMAALRLAWRVSDHNVDEVLTRVVPPAPSGEVLFLRLLLEQKEWAAADKVWDRLSSRTQPFEPADSYLYFDTLLQRGQVAQAVRAWDYVVRMNPYLASNDDKDNLVLDGEFERGIQPGGFGWRLIPMNGVTVGIDSSRYHSANHSLSITYDNAATGTAGVYQAVPVQPSSCYSFSAYVKTEELGGEHGIQLLISDSYQHGTYFKSPEFRGSSAWEALDGVFATPASANLVTIDVIVPSQSPVKGNAWIDDVRIVPAPKEQCESQRQAPSKAGAL